MSYEKTPWGREIPYTSPITGRSTTLYNINVAAEAIGRTPQTIRKWEVAGIIPPTPFRQQGKRLYSKEHIDALVKCAEEAKIKQGAQIMKTSFSKRLYKEFEKINDLFFKAPEGEDKNGKVKK